MSQSIKKTTFLLFLLKFVGLITSLIVLTLSAKYFGISSERDVWLLVTAFLAALAGAIFGPLNETFRAKFVAIREQEGEQEAERKTKSLFGSVIIIMLFLCLVLYINPDFIIKIIAPSVTEKAYLINMLYVLIPTLFINQLIYMGVAILNSYNVFYIPEVVGFFSGLINLICIAILAPYIGIYSLIVSQYIYLIIYFFVVCFFLNRINVRIIPSFYIKWNDIKPFILFSIPFFLPYFVGQCNLIIEKSFSNLLGEGIVSILDYSKKFTLLLQTVLTSVLAAIMVPDLTRCFSRGDLEGYEQNHKKYLEILALILCIFLPVLIGGADDISELFFFRGEMLIESVYKIASLMRYYCFAFFSIGLYLFFGLSLLSQSKGKLYAVLGVAAQLIVMIINISFYKIGNEYTFPLSSAIGHLIASFFMFRYVKLSEKKKIITFLLKVLSIVILASLIIYFESIVCTGYNLYQNILVYIITLMIITFFVTFPLVGINVRKIIEKWKKRN